MVNEYPEKLIVLDIDGCITSINDNTYFNTDPEKYHPSETIINNLKKFCAINNAKILISSNWRKFDIDGTWTNKYGTYKNPLPKTIEMLRDAYYDTLSPTRHVNKSTALINWFVANQDFIGSFVIFDDDLREQFQNTIEYGINNRFIHVDSRYGITYSDLLLAREILNS